VTTSGSDAAAGEVLSWSAKGLPGGLSINPSTIGKTIGNTATVAICRPAIGGGHLDEASFKASTNARSSAADAAQNAITNAGTGQDATRFSTDQDQASGLYFQLDMGSPRTFDGIEMVTANGSTDYARAFEVEVSQDGRSWANVGSCKGTSSPEAVSFPSRDARYLRVVLTQGATTNWWSINQLYVLSPKGGASWAGFPASFWGATTSVLAARNALEVQIRNATNGRYPDSEVYWSFDGQERSVAEQPFIDMGTCTSCRITFYLGSPNGKYSDFMELDIGANGAINTDTSRVDRFGLPVAMHLHSRDGSDLVVGEDYATFRMSRGALFRKFISSVPRPFRQLGTVGAPYYIPSPGSVAAFQPGGADAGYMTAYAASVGVKATTQDVFGCAGGALGADAALCAALNRHVAQLPRSRWDDSSLYYKQAPANYYSAFWHSVAVNGHQYGFPYDDSNGQSSDISSGDPQYLQIAVGY
jgi:hypothetical protein